MRQDLFRRDAEYTLRWPAPILADELKRLVQVAEIDGVTPQWRDEVKLLLRQAFESHAPAEAFERASSRAIDPIFGDEAPF
jgi:hypothetical protein